MDLMATFLDQIEDRNSTLEMVGDFFLTPARLFFGNTYHLVEFPDGNKRLNCPETFFSLTRAAKKVAVIALLPFSLISTLFGLCLKALASQIESELKNKYTLPILVNARTEEDFAGKLPPAAWSPNCVNSQEKSLWGNLYNADPIAVPAGTENPTEQLKAHMATLQSTLVEEKGDYLHYTYTVVIPTGPLQGTYIDDLDFFYNREKGVIDVRSASRSGFRDALHFDFNLPGANKKRIEAIRQKLFN